MLEREADRYQQYHAPGSNNSLLVEPPLGQLQGKRHAQGQQPANDLAWCGKSLSQLRSEARRELLAEAAAYTGSYRNLPALPDAETAEFILTGHQAELFHPGVWFKNFIASRLAAEQQGVGIHLIVDSDLSHNASVRVPTGSADVPRIESIAYDRPAAKALPVERRQLVDRSMFESFASRVARSIAPLVPNPLVTQLWPQVIEALDRNEGNLGLAIAQARHQLEADWLESQPSELGSSELEPSATLEIPLSRCCHLPSFRWFLCRFLADAPQVHEAYNGALASYRQAHHLRSDAQPMPNLAKENDGYETPLWIWSQESPERRPLFARRLGPQVELFDRQGWSTTLDLPANGSENNSAEKAVAQLEELAEQGVCIRTRALTTTLFARLLLGDLFLHGIGGAKYDEVTDDLSERLFGFAPPAYLTLSATLHLPIKHRRGEPGDLRDARVWQREMTYHPEKYLGADTSPEALRLVEEKQRWISTPKNRMNAAERHQSIEAINQSLQPAIAPKRRRLESREAKLLQRVRAAKLLDARDYSFCLFPEEDLRQRMLRLVNVA